MVPLPPVGCLMSIRDEADESGAICQFQVFDRLVFRCAAVVIHRKKQGGTNTTLGWAMLAMLMMSLNLIG